MTVKAIAPWFGAARMIAKQVGQEMRGCRWIGVPFGGGMTELAQFDAPTIVVSDKHRFVINLSRVVSCRPAYSDLARKLRRVAFHPETLSNAQKWCRTHEPDGQWDVEAAFYYFICCWMGRSGSAGTATEFTGSLPVRWNANGGDSNTRYRSAVKSLAAWHKIMCRCNFLTDDCFDFLSACKDIERHGIYCDPPFPDAGHEYSHRFSTADHRRLAITLGGFKNCRVVCRFYGDHPLVQELYPKDLWNWRWLTGGRKQSNASAPEVLIINGPSYATAD